MNRDELIEKTKEVYERFSPPNSNLPDRLSKKLILPLMADMYEAGRQAERERITQRMRLMPYTWHTQELLNELQQTTS